MSCLKNNSRMRFLFNNFWQWYEKHLFVTLLLTVSLFLLQLIHLYWLAADVVAMRLVHHSYFDLSGLSYYIVLFVDYTEIPALVSAGLIYVHELRKHYSFRAVLYICLLLSQVIHMFWITDEFVVTAFSNQSPWLPIPAWLAWVAIAIDYLEVPVIIDTVKRLIVALRHKHLYLAAQILKER